MLHIILFLLKIIGGLILILLCLFLLVIAVVLLVPVRYHLAASRYASVEAEGKVSWLCHLIEFLFQVDTGKEKEQRMHIRLRIACFCIYDNLRPKKERIKKERVRKNKRVETENVKTEDAAESEPVIGMETSAESEPVIGIETSAEKIQVNLRQKLTAVFGRIVSIPSKISSRIQSLAEKAEHVCRKKDKLMAIYHDDKNHLWLTVFLGRLKRLLIRLIPRIDRLFWHFGFNDPATTGRVLGMLSIFYPLCEDRMVLQPEFGQEIMEGEVRLHGSIRLFTFVAFAVQSFLNKQFFSIVKQVKRI